MMEDSSGINGRARPTVESGSFVPEACKFADSWNVYAAVNYLLVLPISNILCSTWNIPRNNVSFEITKSLLTLYCAVIVVRNFAIVHSPRNDPSTPNAHIPALNYQLRQELRLTSCSASWTPPPESLLLHGSSIGVSVSYTHLTLPTKRIV